MPKELLGQTALVLQGGGALGAYQAGVYQALEETGHHVDWLAGISIGSINSALIAGNAPGDRLGKLRQFWDGVSANLTLAPLADQGFVRGWYSELSAMAVASFGIPGFFLPRGLPPIAVLDGSDAALSFYDTSPLRETLLQLVDFDRINARECRLSVGAVHIETGNFEYFDNHRQEIGPEHIMASCALPPGFPPVMIEGEAYWDGGLVSNTPLQQVLDKRSTSEALTVFQVDLFSARGPLPRNLNDVAQREKDIRFSSRTRLNTDMAKTLLAFRHAAKRLGEKLPAELRDDPDARLLAEFASDGPVTIMHLINRPEAYETQAKDYEFSRTTVNGHWQAGYEDALHSLNHSRWTQRKQQTDGVAVFDLGHAHHADA